MEIVIVGSGLGGLIAGAKLSKEGYRVLLIEQHNVVGGCATTFKRKECIIEVGLHEIDGFDNEDIKTVIFRDLGIQDKLTLIPIPELYRVKRMDFDFKFSHVVAEVKEELQTLFPKKKKE